MDADAFEAQQRVREYYQHAGHDPIRDVAVTVNRRRLHVERDLPMKAGLGPPHARS